MPSKKNENLYINAVQWINENPGDTKLPNSIKQDFMSFNTLSAKNKAQLIIALANLLKTTGLPEVIKQALPWLIFDLDALPDHMLLEMKNHWNEADIRNSGSISKRMHSLFHLSQGVLDKFLQRVAFGEQDKAEELFISLYQNNAEKRQAALVYRGKFTDYSGRTFNCSAYEYAYWAKDTYMCRMLERHMAGETKAQMLARIYAIEATGLSFIQNGEKYESAHFDFTQLKTALQEYLDLGHLRLTDSVKNAAAWMKVGKAQRNVPAHVAQEYCREDRPFETCPLFDESTLPRVLTFFRFDNSHMDSWFPLGSPNSGLGYDFAFTRGHWDNLIQEPVMQAPDNSGWQAIQVLSDLRAIDCLDKVRNGDLTQSRKNLTSPATAGPEASIVSRAG